MRVNLDKPSNRHHASLRRQARTHMLASVTNVDEARLCLACGVDLIDCKDPAAGALGALSALSVEAIVSAVNGRVPVSATIGDLPCRSEAIVDAVRRMAVTGCDIVKVGFNDEFGNAADVIDALGLWRRGLLNKRVQLVAVLAADGGFDAAPLFVPLKAAGFAGVMVDTFDKSRGALPDVCAMSVLISFVREANAAGLFAGLAGSLQPQHIPRLMELRPNVLGFRGGLCVGGVRGARLDPGVVRAVAGEINAGFEPIPYAAI